MVEARETARDDGAVLIGIGVGGGGAFAVVPHAGPPPGPTWPLRFASTALLLASAVRPSQSISSPEASIGRDVFS